MVRVAIILTLALIPGCALIVVNSGNGNTADADLTSLIEGRIKADLNQPMKAAAPVADQSAHRIDGPARMEGPLPTGPADLLLTDLATSRPAEVEVLFSPRGGCQAEIVNLIGKAKTNVMLSMYLLTNPAITDALISALHRRVIVNVILDGREMATNGPAATALNKGGVTVWLNTKYAIYHEKLCVIDGYTVIAGSYNYSLTAENANAEDLFIIRNKTVAATCARDFGRRQAESKLFVPTSQKE